MSMFEEGTWDAAPDVNKLDVGLFGNVKSDNPEGIVRAAAKLRRGQRSQKGPTERSNKWKNKKEKNELIAKRKSEGGTRPPGKHKRGKRGNNVWKKRGEEEAPENDSQVDQNQPEERKKKLKLKMKMKQGKGTLPAGKSPRNKYKKLAIMREQQQNSSNSKATESNVEINKIEKPQKETVNKSQPVKEQKPQSLEAAELETQPGKAKKGKKSKSDTQETETPELSELGKKKAKKEKLKIVATQEVTNDEDESMNDTGSQKKKAKKRKELNPILASTPVALKEKHKKTMEAISEGLFTKVKSSNDNASSSEETQPEPSKPKKKKKAKLIQPPSEAEDTLSEDTNEPVKKKKKKKKKLNTDIDNDSFADNVDNTKQLKKKKGKREDSEEENVKSSHPSPQMKSPFQIGKLKHVLDRKPTEGDAVSGKKRKSEALEGSPKAKLKKSEPLSLRERMQAQLSGARFRFINEQLYTCTGEEALQLMQSDPDAFKVYHDGFTSQVEKWPENPVNRVIKFVKARPEAVVADMGCGDAKLAQSVRNKVHSFDLVAVNEHITVCDIAQLPLPDDSVDVAVFCLALMGTNFVDFICEANRTLKTGGTLIIAEVVSRFEKVGAFVRKMAKLGFELSKKDDSNKMFIWFEFTKTSEAPSAERRPNLELTPCTYKKR